MMKMIKMMMKKKKSEAFNLGFLHCFYSNVILLLFLY